METTRSPFIFPNAPRLPLGLGPRFGVLPIEISSGISTLFLTRIQGDGSQVRYGNNFRKIYDKAVSLGQLKTAGTVRSECSGVLSPMVWGFEKLYAR
jgi:hypothetical protein